MEVAGEENRTAWMSERKERGEEQRPWLDMLIPRNVSNQSGDTRTST